MFEMVLLPSIISYIINGGGNHKDTTFLDTISVNYYVKLGMQCTNNKIQNLFPVYLTYYLQYELSFDCFVRNFGWC